MIKQRNAPGKIKALLILCIVGAVLAIGTELLVYSVARNTVSVVGKDTVPQIVAAKNIRATLAGAHSNAMNAMLTKEKLGGSFWNLYRENLNTLHLQLIDASENIKYGEKERLPLLAILSNISAYEYTVGGSVSTGAEISVDQFMEANRLMQQKILPASTALNQANLSQLNYVYNSYEKGISSLIPFMSIIAVVFFIILIATQIYLFTRTRRILNIGLVIATVLFLTSFIYASSAMNSVKTQLNTAKNDAFNSLNALWSARAEAYNANAIESLYLLHNGTGIVQSADTINFNLAAERLSSDSTAALKGEKFEGYFYEALMNASSREEKAEVLSALQQWTKYFEVNKQVRNLEYDSKHTQAINLAIGNAAGQSNYEFAKFDAELEKMIKANQTKFDKNISASDKTLNIFPFIIVGLLAAIVAACTLGLKARLKEYKV